MTRRGLDAVVVRRPWLLDGVQRSAEGVVQFQAIRVLPNAGGEQEWVMNVLHLNFGRPCDV